MAEPTPSTAARLRAALRNSPSGASPDGLYDILRNERFVNLGSDHSRDEARMISLHECFHAFLNSSTTFGNAMMFVGALAEIGKPGFSELLDRMISDAIETHETYATVAAVCALAQDRIDDTLLVSYPDYQGFLQAFINAFGSERSTLAAVALTSCARVAMQTSIYEQLLTTPCSDWPSVTWSQEQSTDWRFKRLLQKAPATAALSAIDGALRSQGEPLVQLLDPALTPSQAKTLLARAPIESVEVLNEASYAAFAQALGAAGVPEPEYEEQRRGLLNVIARVQAHAGDRLNMTFAVPESLEDDLAAVMANYRHERLVLREEPDAARFFDVQNYGQQIVNGFIGTHQAAPYVHFVAMPKDKAAALYGPKDGWEEAQAFPGDVLMGLRRRYVPADGPPCVQFLLVRLPHLVELMSRTAPGTSLVPVLSAAAVDSPSWFDEWERYGAPMTPRWLVEVDTDPFELIDDLGESGATLHMSFARLQADASSTASLIEVLCIVSEARPNQAYVLPCSAPSREAVASYAQLKGFPVDVSSAFLKDWGKLLGPAFSHLIREEGRFGNRFWQHVTPAPSDPGAG